MSTILAFHNCILRVEGSFEVLSVLVETLLLGHWYEIMALYYVKSILTEISASRQDRRVLQKTKSSDSNF